MSIVSVLQASGAIPRALYASAIRTSQPRSSSWSCTKRAPFIDSITASTGSPSPTCRTSLARPSRSGGTRRWRPVPPARRGPPIEAFAAEIQSDVQHAMGLPSSCRGRAEFPSAGGPLSSDSVAPICRYGHSLRPCLAPPIAPDRRVIILNRVLRPPSEDGAIFAAMDGEQISRRESLLKLGGLLAGQQPSAAGSSPKKRVTARPRSASGL